MLKPDIRFGFVIALAYLSWSCQQAQDTEPDAAEEAPEDAATVAAAPGTEEEEPAPDTGRTAPAPPDTPPSVDTAAPDSPAQSPVVLPDSPPETDASTAAATSASALGRQETNWPGVFVEVTEFTRKGNTLTARLRVKNEGTEEQQPQFVYPEMYVMNFDSNQRYDVLNTDGTYVAALRSGWKDRWYESLAPGQQATVWAKFTAPPAEVTTLTLVVPGTPPFEDLPIRDS